MISLARQQALRERLAAEERGDRPKRKTPKFSDIKRRADGSTYFIKEYIDEDEQGERMSKSARRKAYRERSNYHREYDTMSDLKKQHTIQDESVVLSRQFKYTKKDGTESTSRKFLFFNDYIALYEWYKKTPNDKRNYYECITGKRKPYFDFDFNIAKFTADHPKDNVAATAHAIMSSVVVNAQILLPEISFEKDVLIYSSHGDAVISYHVVFDHYMFNNEKEAGRFTSRLAAMLPPRYVAYLDEKVYSSLRQMRLLGSAKVNSDRYKRFNRTFRINKATYNHLYLRRSPAFTQQSNDDIWVPHTEIDDQDYLAMEELRQSLIGFTTHCNHVSGYEDKPSDNPIFVIPDDEKDDLLARVRDTYLRTIPSLSIRNITSNVINLNNNGGYLCPNCVRVHEHENPYIRYTPDHLTFVCRR